MKKKMPMTNLPVVNIENIEFRSVKSLGLKHDIPKKFDGYTLTYFRPRTTTQANVRVDA